MSIFRDYIVKGQRGITGLETALVLIAFVVVASVFAFAALSSGLFSSDRAEGTFRAGLSGARATATLKGNVIAEDTDIDGRVDKLYFQVANAAGGAAIDLTPGKTIVRYNDDRQSKPFNTSAMFSVSPQGASDSDNLLEPGETYELTLLDLETNLLVALTKSTKFTVEILTPTGAVLQVERTMPASLGKFNNLS